MGELTIRQPQLNSRPSIVVGIVSPRHSRTRIRFTAQKFPQQAYSITCIAFFYYFCCLVGILARR
jgi:hypothetical protein